MVLVGVVLPQFSFSSIKECFVIFIEDLEELLFSYCNLSALLGVLVVLIVAAAPVREFLPLV